MKIRQFVFIASMKNMLPLLLLLLLSSCTFMDQVFPPDPAAVERSRSRNEALVAIDSLRYGMTESQVDNALKSAWHVNDCGSSRLYFFGSKNPRLAGVAVVSFKPGPNQDRIAYTWGVVSQSDEKYLDSRQDCLSIELPNA